jgi:hypothetical protein
MLVWKSLYTDDFHAAALSLPFLPPSLFSHFSLLFLSAVGMRTVAIVACAIAAFLPSASGKTPLQTKIAYRHLLARGLQLQAVDAAVWQYAAAYCSTTVLDRLMLTVGE